LKTEVKKKMSWFPRRRRDRWSPFDILDEDMTAWFPRSGLFRQFDESFREMREEMERTIEKARKGELESPEKGGPYVYGWSMRVGPDGVPHFEEFGNTRGIPPAFRQGLPAGREPLVDVMDAESQVKVIAELPGVEKNDVELESTESHLVIKVDTEKRKYYKEIDLPSSVDPESAKATYNNGVLEVTLDKATPDEKGRKISID
jgi:HSP20 family protein